MIKTRYFAHDADKIERLRIDNGWSAKEAAHQFGYTLSTYNRIECKKSNLDVHQFLELAKGFGVDARDLLKDELMDEFPGARLDIFETDEQFNEFLFELEAYGRIGIFNTFPSVIYCLNGNLSREKRLNRLSSYDTKNIEFYPITAVLNFCFSLCSPYSREGKIAILGKIIQMFSEEGHVYNQLNFINTAGFNFPREAPECEIINDVSESKADTLLIVAPFYKYSVIMIRSFEIVKKIKKVIKRDDKILYTPLSVNLLRHLKECIQEELTIEQFLTRLNDKSPGSELVPMLLANLNPDLVDRLGL